MEFYEQLQSEVGPWIKHNFGEETLAHQVLGIIEELCELEGAIFNGERDDIEDAIGDTMIFMTAYCVVANINLQQDVFETKSVIEFPAAYHNIVEIIGHLAHVQLKMDQNIRGENMEHLISGLCSVTQYLTMVSTDFLQQPLEKAVEKVWNVVKQRDWQKNKLTGVNDNAGDN